MNLELKSEEDRLADPSEFGAFMQAVSQGNMEFLVNLSNQNPMRFQTLIKNKNFAAYKLAVKKGNLDLIQYFEEKTTHLLAMIEANWLKVYRIAARAGHLQVLKHIDKKCSEIDNALEPLGSMEGLYATIYELAYDKAVKGGHLDVMEYLECTEMKYLRSRGVAPEKIQAMIKSNRFRAYQSAAKYGHLAVMQHLEEKIDPQDIQVIIESNEFEVYCRAAMRGHLAVMQHIEARVGPDQIYAMIVPDNLRTYMYAAARGHLAVMQHLEEVIDLEKIQAILESDQYNVYNDAAAGGHLAVMKHLEALLAPQQIQEMIESNNFMAYKSAAKQGHLDVMQHLEKKIDPQKIPAIIESDEFGANRCVVQEGHLAVMKHFEARVSREKIQATIVSDNFGVYCLAAAKGHLAIMQHLEECVVPEQLQAILDSPESQKNTKIFAYTNAARNGHLNVMQHLEARVGPDQIQAIIATNDFWCPYGPYQGAVNARHLDVIQHLEKKVAPEKMQELIGPKDSIAYAWAATDGDLIMMQHLEKMAGPQKIKELIAAGNYKAYAGAASANQFLVLEYLEAKAPEQIPKMMTAENCKAFESAFSRGHHEVCEHLLRFPYVYDYLERHSRENQGYKIAADKQTSQFLSTICLLVGNTDPDQIFDFDESDARKHQEQALYGYYVLRHLIRTLENNQHNLEYVYRNIDRLLMIPSIRALVIQNATQTHLGTDSPLGDFQFARQSNELLRVAQRVNDRVVINRLFSIPEILNEAQAHNFYTGRSATNLREMAQDRESSMVGLNPMERALFDEIENAYKETVIKAGGTSAVMDEIRKKLEELFYAPKNLSQRQVKCRGVTLEMPFSAKELAVLLDKYKPSNSERQSWFEVYYGNIFHTAWRYIAKPNLWMDPNAHYVKVSTNQYGKKFRWSTFEEYSPIIAFLYCAAADQTRPPMEENMSTQDRVELFFRALSLINRQHNWDRYRHILDAEGNPIPRLKEQYDDMRGDRPSCLSGVLRNLLQSLIDHPLFTFRFLNPDLAKDFIKEQIRAHYMDALSLLTVDELIDIKGSIDRCIFDFEDESMLLQSLRWNDIDAIKSAMEKEYPGQAFAFESLVPIVLYSMDEPNGRQMPNALINHYTELGLENLIDDLISEKSQRQKV